MQAYLRNREFRCLSIGSAWHAASFQGEQVLVGVLAYQLTGSTQWVGIAYALAFLPMLLIGIPAGATADRLDRRRLLPRLELVQIIIMAVMAALYAYGFGSLPLVLVFTFVSGCVRAMVHPVRLSYAHDVIGASQLVGALGFLSVTSRIGQLIGALAAGFLFEYRGAVAALIALVLFHAVAFVLLSKLQTGGQPKEIIGVPFKETCIEYLRELRHNPVLWRLTVLASIVEVFGFSFATALPELAAERLRVGSDGLGLLHGARSIGGMLAALALTYCGALNAKSMVYTGVIVGFGVSLLVLAAVPSLALALIAVALVAACAASCDVLVQSMMQLCVADKLRGRAMGAWVLALGAGPVGHVEVGLLAGFAGAGAALATNAVVLLLTGALAYAVVRERPL
ncbi:MAG: MFS transporter [Gammaproteobacteria bacterium]|nr:MFS transporter [Gammaproteobacteria bacterium]